MASIFTVRDKQGNIIEIPALQGPPGKDGIYVGTGEMPDGYYVQIDPEGEEMVLANVPIPTADDTGKTLIAQNNGSYTLTTLSASNVSGGTFTGAVAANAANQNSSTSLLRNSKLVSTETNPSVNGEIYWTYE